MYVTVESALAVARDGSLTAMVGMPVSTLNVALAESPAAAKFPARSDAEFALIVIPRVPLFLKPERVTIFFAAFGAIEHGPGVQPTPGSGVTLMTAEATGPEPTPVALMVMSFGASVMASVAPL